jgi:hypothetical protein
MAESSDRVGEGSQAGASGPDSTPPAHELIKKLLAHKPESQDVVEVVGYIGPSPKTGTFRVYPQLDLRSYFEIPAGSLIHHAPVDASDESGPSRVLIAGSTKLEIVHVVDARFLRGYIASAHPLAASNDPSQGGTHGTTKAAPKPPPPTTSEHHQFCSGVPAAPPQTAHDHQGDKCPTPPPTTSNH